MTTSLAFERAAIPLGLAWSSPFCRWQGPLSAVSSLDLAVDVTARALAGRGSTRPLARSSSAGRSRSRESSTARRPLAGAARAPARHGPDDLAGVRHLGRLRAAAAAAQGGGADGAVLVVTTDRTSNGPHLVYPSAGRAGRRRPTPRTGCSTTSAATRGRASVDARDGRGGRRRGRRSTRPSSTSWPSAATSSTSTHSPTTARSSASGWSRSSPAAGASRSRSTRTGASARSCARSSRRSPRRGRAASSATARRPTRPTAPPAWS